MALVRSTFERRKCQLLTAISSAKADEQQIPKPSNVLKSSGFGGIKSRKENIQDSPLVTININPIGNDHATRKVSIPKTSAAIPPGASETDAASSEEIRKPSQTPAPTGNQVGTSRPASATHENPTRRISQPFATTNNSGIKRQRVVTPAAAKVIDDEDEPRPSPSIRKASQASARTDGKENDRVVLGGIENI